MWRQKKIDSACSKGKVRLGKEGIGDAGFELILTKETRQFVSLSLQSNELSSLSMLRMREAKWASLTDLWLGQNIIGVKGCKYLSRVCIPHIKVIGLNKNQISSLGVSHLAKAKWTNLHRICLDKNRIGFDGVKNLSSAKWHKLNYIRLQSNELFVGQIYRLILCVKQKNIIYEVQGIKYQQFYEDNLRSILKVKDIELKRLHQ